MITEEKITALADEMCFGSVPADMRAAAHRIVPLWRRQRDCLFWVAGVVVGRGGIPLCDLQAITGAAARGDDWAAVRDHLAEKRLAAAQRPMWQLRRG